MSILKQKLKSELPLGLNKVVLTDYGEYESRVNPVTGEILKPAIWLKWSNDAGESRHTIYFEEDNLEVLNMYVKALAEQAGVSGEFSIVEVLDKIKNEHIKIDVVIFERASANGKLFRNFQYSKSYIENLLRED